MKQMSEIVTEKNHLEKEVSAVLYNFNIFTSLTIINRNSI